ncbi:MAG: SRPBCC domain-containing protein [Candidatus Kapaibacterium sp.]
MSFIPTSGTYVLQLRRTIKAPLQRLYEAMERDEDRTIWMNAVTTLQPMVGGRYQSANGADAEFMEFHPQEFWRLEWKNPRHTPGSEVVIKFVKNSRRESTIFVRHWRIRSKIDYDELYNGWLSVLDSLEDYLERGKLLDPDSTEAAS